MNRKTAFFPQLKLATLVALAGITVALPASADSGTASYYGHELAGRPTASGERFNPNGLTAAHRSLPLGTRLVVTNIANGRSVVVRVNDRGPFVRSRVLDVSLGAARALGFTAAGTARVHFVAVSGSRPAAARQETVQESLPPATETSPQENTPDILIQTPA